MKTEILPKIKNRIIICSLLVMGIFFNGFAQTDQRTVTTKIADVLAKAPALNANQLNNNMEIIAGIGEKGLLEMVNMLSPQGKGDNTNLQYTINSFSYFVMQQGREKERVAAERAYVTALQKVPGAENKSFLIGQLQIVGSDYALNTLKGYLKNDRLCDDAARALVIINTSNAAKSLLAALPASTGNKRISIVQSLGEMKVKEAVPQLTKLATGTDAALTRVSLFALASIGDLASQPVLANAAKRSGYTFTTDNATAAYLLYIQQLAKNGRTSQAVQFAQAFNNTTGNTHTKSAALQLITEIDGEKSMPLLIQAMNNDNSAYRIAALKLASKMINDNNVTGWLQKLNSSTDEVKAEIITMLGETNAGAALPALQQAIGSKNTAVRSAAISAMARIGKDVALPSLLNVLKTGTSSDVETIKKELLMLPGNNVASTISGALPTMQGASKAALIDVLAARAYSPAANDFLNLVNDKDSKVSNAAAAGLKSVVTLENLQQLFPLLISTNDPQNATAIQQAIVVALNKEKDVTKRDAILQEQLSKALPDKQDLFYNIIAQTGGNTGIQLLSNAFSSGSESSKKSVAQALSGWKYPQSAEALFNACETMKGTSYFETALNGYIRLAKDNFYTKDQQVLMLRRAMELCNNSTQKVRILKDVSGCSTFPAMIFAGRYLDDPALQSTAALTVMNIALAHPEWNGDVVKQLLQKASSLLKGQDSDYQRKAIAKHLSEMPAGAGFVSIFNGKDLTGWKGLVANPIKRAAMDAATLEKEQAKADEVMRKGWAVKNGELIFQGAGNNLCTEKKYGDIEMFVDWKIQSQGDAGIYLRGTPQVQIWDTSRTDVGAEVGSGGLYNNAVNQSKPLRLADNAIGDWNTFHIIMKGDKVTVYLNGILVVDNVTMENYWNRKIPLFTEEQIELQAHGTIVAYRDIYVRELPVFKPFELSDVEKKDGFKVLFDGTNLDQWTGNKQSYVVEDGNIVVKPSSGSGGNLYTKEEFSDFVYRFEFQLTPGANNGIGIRTPMKGDAAYVGMEIQVLDNDADIYKKLHVYQYHGSVYGVIAAKRGYLKPLGEWNEEEIVANGNKIKVTLNGVVIVDGDITDAIKNGTLDKLDHPGLKNKTGHIAFLGHGDVVRFRNIRIKDLSK